MSDHYVKLVVLLSKRADISVQEFRDYYENKHSKFIKLLPRVQRYMRRYLQPLNGHPFSVEAEQQEHHVITELWFNSREDLDFALARNARADVAAILAEDEERLFDRSKGRIYVADERHSDLEVDRPAAE